MWSRRHPLRQRPRYIASNHQPRITRLSATDPSPAIDVPIDGWAFPKAGVAFVWVLAAEITASTKTAR